MEHKSKEYRICYLANAASVHTQRWVNRFADRGWNVDIITWHLPSANKIHQNVKVHRINFPRHYIGGFGALLEISRLMRKIRPDIVHAHYVSHFGVLASLYARLTGFRPIVLSAWGSDILEDAKGLREYFIRQAIKRADCIHCDAEHMRKPLIKLGADPEKIKLVYFGTDILTFSPGLADPEFRKDFKISDSPTIISTRSLNSIYDIQSLIKSVPRVLKEVPDAKFIIVGRGDQEVKLRNLAKALGVSNNVRFTGFIPNEQLPKYLGASDIYVSTSLSDAGLAASTAEAMSCGLPVIITDFGDNRKWVKDGANGYLVPLSNPEALASKIIYLLNNKEERLKLGRAGREIIEDKNSYFKEMEKMENIYFDLIQRYKQ